ncbi:hypothetical protein M9H77_01411 [Catharanthus roseus]|uniref:Uncharacterized protein n=1 Tax=Catharanthus roseus TaxID=4058 RepID=A0ACC0C5L1_CATRO|nr:hypothetical protein M9H77_01411 [Catharanthus roseus]
MDKRNGDESECILGIKNFRPLTVCYIGLRAWWCKENENEAESDDKEEEVSIKVGTTYNILAMMKKQIMQEHNTVEEVFCLSAQRDYTVFYRNCDGSDVLSDIVIAHLTSIQMMRMWPYVLIQHIK